ncbi:MAG: TolC family protein [Ignavibacteria bacterium]|nr:MAG: TolC family protein [Ignavibacteria bacterium]
MKGFLVPVLGALFTLLANHGAFGQAAKTLTLQGSIDLALEKNVFVTQARNTLEAQQSAKHAAVGAMLPSLDLSGAFSRNQIWSSQQAGVIFVQGIPISVGGTDFRANNSFSTGLSSQVTLFNGFANTSRVSQSQSTAAAADYSLDRTQQTTINTTVQLYLDVVRTSQLLKVSEDNLKRSEKQLDRITESNKVGAVAVADVYRQKVQVGSDELALIQTQSAHEKAKADLVAYLGVDFDQEYKFDFAGIPDNIDTTEFAAVNAKYTDFENLYKSAVEKRPDYQASIQNLNAADAGISMARAGYFPSLSLLGSYGYNNTELSTLTDNRNLYFGVNISMPIFSGFRTQDQVEQAQVTRRNADEQLRQAQRQVRVDIRKALLDLESAEKQVTVTQASVKSAEMDRKIAEEKYNPGSGTLLDLLVATANYTTTVSNKVNAVILYLQAKKQTEYALGTLSK